MSFELRAEEFTVLSNAQNSDGRTHERTAVWMYVRMHTQRQRSFLRFYIRGCEFINIDASG